MKGDVIQVRLVLDTQGEPQERAEQDLQYLLDDILQIGGTKVDREPAGPRPPGAKVVDAVTVGALLIALGSSGAALPALVGLVRDWLARRGTGTVRLKIGSDEVEITEASSELQRRALDEFLTRHREGTER
jgi:hypothetical protein